MFSPYRIWKLTCALAAVCAVSIYAAAAEGSTPFTPKPEEQEIVRLTNEQRAQNGLPPLSIDEKLTDAARHHSDEMARTNTLGHTIGDSTMTSRIKATGYRYLAIGENIAFNQPTPNAVVDSWMHSPGHRANILNKSYTEIGVGVAKNAHGEPYYTQDFGRPGSAGPTEQATFSITNQAGSPATITLPGNDSKSVLDNGQTGQFNVAGTGQLPPIDIAVGNATKKLNFEDGAAYIVSKTAQGLEIQREPVK